MNSQRIEFAEEIKETKTATQNSNNGRGAVNTDRNNRSSVSERRRKLEKVFRVLRWLVIILLGPAALIVSVISAIHLVKWFGIGDSNTFASWTAGAFEFLAIASMFTIIELSRLPKFVVFLIWTVIIGLVFLQINGNAFHVFDYMQTHRDMVERAARFYRAQPGPEFERTLAFAIGAPLPIISMFIIKILSSYWMLAFNRLKVKRSVK